MIDILVFLPDLLDGLFSMLSDKMAVLVLRQPEEKAGSGSGSGPGVIGQARAASSTGMAFPGGETAA
eukprot:scaffold256459_cov15-Prasinocladus_malaysianus.AAC.1